MATNIEIKARARDFERLKKLVECLSDTTCELLVQEDTFFNISSGRLKLRIFNPDYGELIYYERPDTTGPKQSKYIISKTLEPFTLRATLVASLGIKVVVRKQRLLYKIGQMRVHLDDVEGLGLFVEFEHVMRPGEDPEKGLREARDLMQRLEIPDEDLLAQAYADLLLLE
jgi:predicted adenylyl cyclase CyaB